MPTADPLSAEPHAYPRRILVVVTGISPQVITETLFALSQGTPAFIPTETHVITTAKGAEHLRATFLDDPEDSALQRLVTDYGLPPETARLQLHTVTAGNGRPLTDIVSVEDNEALADLIAEQVQGFCSDPDAAVHASIAGGRKTMGYYLGHALSLFGRPQDRLSHVLVDTPFEACRNFYYPPPRPMHIACRDGGSLDASEAQVHLADIPFIRIGQPALGKLRDGRIGFNEAVRTAQSLLDSPARLRLDYLARIAVFGEVRVQLPAMQFAFLAWLARYHTKDLPPLLVTDQNLEQQGAPQLLQELENVRGYNERSGTAIRSGYDTHAFNRHLHNLRDTLNRQLGAQLAKRYLPTELPESRHGQRRFQLPLPSSRISFDID